MAMKRTSLSPSIIKLLLAFILALPQSGKAEVKEVDLNTAASSSQNDSDFLVIPEIQIPAMAAKGQVPSTLPLADSRVQTFLISNEAQFEAVFNQLKITTKDVNLYLVEKGEQSSVTPWDLSGREPSGLNFLGSFVSFLKSKWHNKILNPFRLSLKHFEEDATKFEKFSKFFNTNQLITLTVSVGSFAGVATATSLFIKGGLSPMGLTLLGIYSAMVSGGYVLFNDEFLKHIGYETRPETHILDKIGLARDSVVRSAIKEGTGWAKNIIQVVGTNIIEEFLFVVYDKHSEGFSVSDVVINVGGDFASSGGIELFLSSIVKSFQERYPGKKETIDKVASAVTAVKEVVTQALIAASYAGSHTCQVALYAIGGVGFALYFGEMGFRTITTRSKSKSSGAPLCEAAYMGI